MSKLAFRTKFWFGLGQAAEGIKNGAFAIFLLFYYTQILGLPGWLTSLGLFLALTFDAVSDPIAGSLSDSLDHRWGRRHPFMYASALPLAVAFALVFSPPSGLGQLGLFLWLTTFTVLARAAMTLYHVPHLALGAELTEDVQERSIVVAYRTFFQYLGTASLFVVTGVFFFRATETILEGQRNPEAYPPMGVTFGIVMLVSILLSALGTHSVIPRLPRPPADLERFSTSRVLGEVREALQNSSFRPFVAGILLFFIASGTERALQLHMGTYFWRLDGSQIMWIPTAALISIMLSIPIWARLSRRIEKRTLFLVGLIWYCVPTLFLPLIKIWGWFPAHDDSLYIPLILCIYAIAAGGAGGPLIAAGSMLADIADEHELVSGRRQEGIFFGGLSFSGKAAVGLGAGLAGLIISGIAFPLQADPATVPIETVNRLALYAGPGVGLLALVGIAMMSRYRLTRQRVTEIQAILAERRLDREPEKLLSASASSS